MRDRGRFDMTTPLTGHAREAMSIGMAGEHLVCADLLMKGYRAFLAAQGFAFDVVLDLDGQLIRIQVKSSLRARNVVCRGKPPRIAHSFSVSRRGFARQKRLSSADCDIIALAALDCRMVAYFPVRYAAQTIQLSLSGDAQHGGNKGRIGAIDGFPIEAALVDDQAIFERRRLYCRSGHPKAKGAICKICRRAAERARGPRNRHRKTNHAEVLP